MRLKSKIITIIALTIVLTVGTTTFMLLKMQNTKMVAAKLEDTEFLCDIIERTTESAMKKGNTGEVQNIIENIGKNTEILVLRVLSPDGTILKSKNKMEIGAKAADFIRSSFDRKSQKPTLINDATINFFHTINNRAECYSCHDKSNLVIGIIQIKQDVSRNEITFLSIKKLLVFSNIAIVLIVAAMLSFLFSHFVLEPLRNLLLAIQDVESGNWQAFVNVKSNDELGVIGSSFNKMIHEINKLYKKNLLKETELSKIRVELEHKYKIEDLNSQLEFKIKELETANKAIISLSKEVKGKNIQLEMAIDKLKRINEIGRVLTSITETRELMNIIIQTAADLLNAEKVTMHLRNFHEPPITMQYQRSIGIKKVDNFSFELDQGYTDLFINGRPLFISGLVDPNSDDGVVTPQMGVPLKMKGQILGAMLVENASTSGTFTENEMDLLSTLANQAVVAIENAWLYEGVKSNYFSTIQSLVNALEASDRFTKGHSERVRMLSVELGRHVGLDFKELELLEHASILHDIGKIGIDNLVLQKQGKLTSHEYSLIKTHPLIGDEILGPIETLDAVRKTIIQHHERYDGNGYPYGLQGDEISLKSRILSVADTFDAMMTDRPYRKALSLHKVKEELKSNAGSQFDPYIVEAFINMINAKGEDILATAGYNTLYSAM